MAARPATVAILALPESSASVVYGMYDLFISAGRDWGVIVEGRPGPELMRPKLVCVPELAVAPGEPLEGRFAEEIAWLKRCYAAGATLATACSGAILLAEAGLLEGQAATTHWAYCDLMRRRHPRVRLRPEAALVVSGDAQRLVMAGGGTSWLDLGLYLIARCAGVEAAMQVARINLIDWHDIGQQPFARLARTRQSEDAIIGRCQEWIAAHYQEASPVAAMARLSGLAERSFKRRFRQATGLSPLEYVHTLRLEEAKQLLESGDRPIEAIAEEVGYEDAGFFGRLFRRNVRLTPAQYRRRFRSMRQALERGDTSAHP